MLNRAKPEDAHSSLHGAGVEYHFPPTLLLRQRHVLLDLDVDISSGTVIAPVTTTAVGKRASASSIRLNAERFNCIHEVLCCAAENMQQ